MRIIADLHIHSPYARAVSKNMTLENLDYWAGIKGITVMATGDFTHPLWIKEIQKKLEPAESGLYVLGKRLRSSIQKEPTRFMLGVEISSIYSQGGKVRRVHNLVMFPSIESAEKFNTVLGTRGNLRSDGRPIVGVSSKELLKMAFDVDPQCVFVPAHIWTPWFSLFGSKSGFDTLEECFEEHSKLIFALETGLSSDPAMNWRVSKLDKYSLISNSDSHSLRRIGREVNIVKSDLSYKGIWSAIKSKNPKRFLETIEYFPEEGMYHFDGHRVCKVRMEPKETKRKKGLCPKCKRPVTIGVVNQVEKLADRPADFLPPKHVPFKNMVPLDEIIAESLGVGVASKKVQTEYLSLIEKMGSEFFVLYEASLSQLAGATTPEVAEGIKRVREKRLFIDPGYDGEYGKVKIFERG